MFSPWFRSALRHLPSQCLVCHAWPAQSVCLHCTVAFSSPVMRCSRCALPTPGLAGFAKAFPGATAAPSALCGSCLRLTTSPPTGPDTCLAALPYAYPWSGLITRFKFGGDSGLARPLAELMRHAPGVAGLLAECDAVLPMPLSDQRLRERGFNQALLLAQALAPDKTRAQWLLRIRDTPPQTALPRPERLRNLDHALALEPLHAEQAAGQHMVLVDDVMTTGTSLLAAAQVLRQAGARQVSAVVLARAE
ncbi:MAG: ComF family protein [Burkholderiaceae bacterium]